MQRVKLVPFTTVADNEFYDILFTLWAYYFGNLGFVTHSGAIVKLPSNKADKYENFRICLLRDCIG